MMLLYSISFILPLLFPNDFTPPDDDYWCDVIPLMSIDDWMVILLTMKVSLRIYQMTDPIFYEKPISMIHLLIIVVANCY